MIIRFRSIKTLALASAIAVAGVGAAVTPDLQFNGAPTNPDLQLADVLDATPVTPDLQFALQFNSAPTNPDLQFADFLDAAPTNPYLQFC